MDTNAVDALLQSASNYGFPMLISCYLLVRMEKRMEALTNACNELTVALKQKLN